MSSDFVIKRRAEDGTTSESEVDTDISGIGVTTALFIITVFSFGFLLYGFRRKLIIDDSKNPTDRVVLNWLGSKTAPFCQYRNAERRAFQAVMQCLGDQQLIIGVALLFCGIISWGKGELSSFGLGNLVALGWINSAVHLCTLIVLSFSKNLQNDYKTPKLIRIILMVTMLILHLSLSVVYILPFLSYPITIIADVILMFVLLHEYVREMAFYYGGKAYWEKYRGGFFRHALLAVFVSRRKTDENVAFPEFGYSLLRHVRESRWIWDPDADARQQFYESPISARLERSGLGTRLDADVNSKLGRHYLLRMLRAPTDKADSNQLIRKMRCLLHLGGRLPLELDRCLSERLLMLSFVMGQSLVRFSHRWAEHADLSDSDKKDVLQWGSGQIIAVVVLIAPLFSWVHAFYADSEGHESLLELPALSALCFRRCWTRTKSRFSGIRRRQSAVSTASTILSSDGDSAVSTPSTLLSSDGESAVSAPSTLLPSDGVDGWNEKWNAISTFYKSSDYRDYTQTKMAAYLGVIIDTCILKGTLGYTHEILEIMAIVPAAMWVFYLAIQTFTTLKKDRETRLSKVRDQSHGRMPSVQPSNPETATEASSYPSRRDTCHLQLSDSLERLKEKEDKLAQLRYDLELMQLEVDRASEHSAEIKTQLGMMDALRFLGWESDLDTRSADVESLGEV